MLSPEAIEIAQELAKHLGELAPRPRELALERSSAPQYTSALTWRIGDSGQRQSQLVAPAAMAPIVMGWVRIVQTNIALDVTIEPPDARSIIGPFDAPALISVELPCMVRLTPKAAPTGDDGSAVVIASQDGFAGAENYARRSDTVALGGSLTLDNWTRSAVVYAAGVTGQWLDAAGVVLATWSGPGRSVRPPNAATLAIAGGPSLVVREW